MKLLTAACALALAMPGASWAITVTQNSNATALGNAILGSGVTINTATLTGASVASGTFSNGAGSIGIADGIILSTGNVATAVGPNNATGAGTNLPTGGFPELNALIPQTTQDGVKLDINFSTTSGSVFFQYAFASEEYNEFVNTQFNDVFALFLNGVNIAIVPGTSDAVSINTVNCGNPFGSNPQKNCSSYVNNSGGAFNIQYDGFTKVFTASGTGLTGNNTLSFAIADAGDGNYDSAIFIKGGSLSDKPPEPEQPGVVPLPAGAWLLLGGLGGLATLRRRKRA